MRHDWKALKHEYVTGKEPVLSEFFRRRKVPRTTWGEKTTGWKAKREEHQQKTHELAATKTVEIQAQRLAKRAEDAQEMMDISFTKFKAKASKLSSRQAADIYKIASEVQDRATRPLVLPTQDNPAVGFAVGVEISDDDRRSIRIVAKSIANAEAGL